MFAQPPWTRELPTATVLRFATLGPVGTRLRAPGTWGSLAGLGYFYVAFSSMGILDNLITTAIGSYFAVALCGEAEVRLGRHDPGEVVLDEFVAMPLCFLGWQGLLGTFPAWTVLLGGFALFRLYDIAKPLVINSLQALPGGWGVVADDLAAALAACATLHIIHIVWVMV